MPFIHLGHDHGEPMILISGLISRISFSTGKMPSFSTAGMAKNSMPSRSQQVYSPIEKSEPPICTRIKLKPAPVSGSKHFRRIAVRSACDICSRL